ncbi:SRPBCC domain-containing protein [Candidatus Daviesbacteria bacterium]|nr:SRPBCC domain-containing protein [Candidatus Daviesbacteria bacterium]
MKIIRQTYLISAARQAVWQALINPVSIDKWGGGPAHMNDKVGTEFTLWGGDIYGKNIKVVDDRELVQEWFGGKWEKPSKVTFSLKDQSGKTKIDLLHENIPDSEAKDINEGWKSYYLGPIKELLEEHS